MSNFTKCEKCEQITVVSEFIPMTDNGESMTCLNCGWRIVKDYLDDENLLSFREIYEDEIKEWNLELEKID